MPVHQLHGLIAAHRMELRVLRFGDVELVAPASLEVDGVDQEHHLIGVDRIENRRDFSRGRCAHPIVDRLHRCRVAEVQRGRLRVERRLRQVEEALIEWEAVAIPDGVRDAEVDGGVEPTQQRNQRLVPFVDLGIRGGGEAEGRPHLIVGRPSRAIHRHTERHGCAQGRGEDVRILLRHAELPKQGERKIVCRGNDLHLPGGEGPGKRLQHGGLATGRIATRTGRSRTGDGARNDRDARECPEELHGDHRLSSS